MLRLRQFVSRGGQFTAQFDSAALYQSRLNVPSCSQANVAAAKKSTWKTLQDQGFDVNPCGSWHHPAVKAGLRPAENEKSIQEAYTPSSTCFGCGTVYSSYSGAHNLDSLWPCCREMYVSVLHSFETWKCIRTGTTVSKAQCSKPLASLGLLLYAGPAAGDHGLHLRSFRSNEGLEAIMEFSDKFTCFPNVVNGGAISTALDCHGNWCAAMTLMDEACLPWPPLTVTYSIGLTYRQPTPPNTPLILAAKVILLNAVSRSISSACYKI